MSDYSAASHDNSQIGTQIYDLISELFPICRSITGNGFRESLHRLQAHVPLTLHEIPTGTPVFDWTVPREWNIRDAFVKNSAGVKVIDFQASNLHVVNYSVPIHRAMGLAELREHLFTLPDQPDCIPYRTSYYRDFWGFCLSHKAWLDLAEGNYEVVIDSSLTDGHLTYGEYYLAGQTDDEILISTHCCHPSLGNDNLSGMALSTFMAKCLSSQLQPPRYSYRFLFIPGTIGAITWLQMNQDHVSKIKHGLVVACVGDPGKLHYKKSRRGNAEIDRAVVHVLEHSGQPYEVHEFSPYGYDERQYCSPGFNLPVGSLTRTPHGRYPEYHTSADNLDLIKPASLADSFDKYLAVFGLLEANRTYLNTNPKCEPQLGRRGLYSASGGRKDSDQLEIAMLWVLNYSDGSYSLLDIAEKSKLSFTVVHNAAQLLEQHGLLVELTR